MLLLHSPEERDIWVKFARAALASGNTAENSAADADRLLGSLRARNPDDPIHTLRSSVPTGPGFSVPTGAIK